MPQSHCFTMAAAHQLLLCALMATLALALANPPPPSHPPAPAKPGWHPHMPHLHMPHLHMPHPHLSPKFKANLVHIKECVKKEIVKLPGGVGHLMSNCLASISMGPPAFGACVAGKGIMSAARATSHIAVCVG